MGALTSKPSPGPFLPIVYDPAYNVRFFGLEKLHAFDSCKYEKIVDMLVEWGVVKDPTLQFFTPGRGVTDAELLQVHSQKYIDSTRDAEQIARYCEAPLLRHLPNWLVSSQIVEPMRWAAQGTVLAGRVAERNNWAINIGGGMHHAGYDKGGGWCVFADVFLSFLELHKSRPYIKKMMIIDLDVHQGNGFEHSKAWLKTKNKDLSVYILDGYNPSIYPRDAKASRQIDQSFYITHTTTDESYLQDLSDELRKSCDKFRPDIIYYNAGTDVLKGDPLNGGVGISQEAVVARDQMVFEFARARGIPIVMVLSGGYAEQSAATVALSIDNIISRFYFHERR